MLHLTLGCDYYALCVHFQAKEAMNQHGFSAAERKDPVFYVSIFTHIASRQRRREMFFGAYPVFQGQTQLHACPGGVLACLTLSFLLLTKMLCGKPPVPDTLSQSQIEGEASSSRLNYTGETRNSSRAEAAWTQRKNTPTRVATEQSTRLVFPGSQNPADYCRYCEPRRE